MGIHHRWELPVVATLENQGRHCPTFIFLTLDCEKKPSLREFLTGSLEIYSRLSLSLAEAGLRTNDAHLSCGVNLQRRHLGGFSPLHGWGKEGRRTFS